MIPFLSQRAAERALANERERAITGITPEDLEARALADAIAALEVFVPDHERGTSAVDALVRAQAEALGRRLSMSGYTSTVTVDADVVRIRTVIDAESDPVADVPCRPWLSDCIHRSFA